MGEAAGPRSACAGSHLGRCPALLPHARAPPLLLAADPLCSCRPAGWPTAPRGATAAPSRAFEGVTAAGTLRVCVSSERLQQAAGAPAGAAALEAAGRRHAARDLRHFARPAAPHHPAAPLPVHPRAASTSASRPRCQSRLTTHCRGSAGPSQHRCRCQHRPPPSPPHHNSPHTPCDQPASGVKRGLTGAPVLSAAPHRAVLHAPASPHAAAGWGEGAAPHHRCRLLPPPAACRPGDRPGAQRRCWHCHTPCCIQSRKH